ncbi:MAG: hypothetical protein IPG93_22070 [Burkholderiales bacterium]|nr:hypothetical protein [Burkholderiales bacterium]
MPGKKDQVLEAELLRRARVPGGSRASISPTTIDAMQGLFIHPTAGLHRS